MNDIMSLIVMLAVFAAFVVLAVGRDRLGRIVRKARERFKG